MDKMKVTYEVMLGLAAEMVWDEALRNHRGEELYREIDRALASGDEAAFLNLTDELKLLYRMN
ncbi:IDEAL domain-containing protein [Paenibacillus pini]